MAREQIKLIYKGTFFLSLAQFLSKLLSAAYKLPLQNWTGDQGFYLYQQLYPFYGLLANLAMTALPLYFSKLFSDYEEDVQVRRLGQRMFIPLFLLLFLLAALLFFSSNQLAQWMGDSRLGPGLQMISFYYPWVAVLAVLRAYFQCQLRMQQTASSQLIEQFIRVASILCLSYAYLKNQLTLEQFGQWVYIGPLLGALGSSVYLIVLYIRSNVLKTRVELTRVDFKALAWPRKGIELLKEGLVYSALISLLILLQLVDSFTVVNELVQAGLSTDQASSVKGVYDRALPLAQLGLVFTTAIISSSLPWLNRLKRQQKQLEFQQAIRSLFKLVFLFSAASSLGLILLMSDLNLFLFKDQLASTSLALFMLVVCFMSVIMFFANLAYIQGQLTCLWPALILTLVLKYVFNQLFISSFNIMGAALASQLTLACLALYLIILAKRRLKIRLFQWDACLKIGLIFFLMASAVVLCRELLDFYFTFSRLGLLFKMGLEAGLGVLVFLTLLARFNLLTATEWAILPFQSIWQKRSKK